MLNLNILDGKKIEGGEREDRGERGLQSITTANISSHLPRLSLGFHWLDGLDNGLERH